MPDPLPPVGSGILTGPQPRVAKLASTVVQSPDNAKIPLIGNSAEKEQIVSLH